MKKVINKPGVAPKRSKLIVQRETIALLAALQLNGVASGLPPATAGCSTETMDVACDTTVSTQTH